MREKIKLSSIKDIIILSKKIISNYEKRSKSRALPRSLCQSALEFRAFPRTSPDPRFLSHPYFKMLGCRSRADVATWRRRDVAVTSMFYSLLLQKLLSPLLFSLHRTCIQNKHQIRNLNTKNYIINIKSTWK